MKFLLQQGYGMKAINEEFAKKYDDIGIILSPRAANKTSPIGKIKEHSQQLKKKGVEIMFDPQFYVPKTNLSKLLRFPYFNYDQFETMEFNELFNQDFCNKAIEYQLNEVKVDKIIIPGRYTNSITDDWYDMHESFIQVAEDNNVINKKKILTLALGEDVIKNKGMFDKLVDKCINYPVDGFYIVLKTPNFLIKDELYIYSLLDGLLSLVLADKEIIFGYGNQQSLFWSAVGIDYLATGNYRNVRSFDPDIFMEEEDDDVKRKSTWYFDAYSFGEYKIAQLSLAFRRNMKDMFGPQCNYCKELLNSNNPANIPWKESMAFKHYFTEIKNEIEEINKVGKVNRLDLCIEKLKKIQEQNLNLMDKGFNIGVRGFSEEVSDATINALIALKRDRKIDLSQL